MILVQRFAFYCPSRIAVLPQRLGSCRLVEEIDSICFSRHALLLAATFLVGERSIPRTTRVGGSSERSFM